MTVKKKARLTSYNFWVRIVSAVVLILRIVLSKFGIKIDSAFILDIATLVAGFLVVVGIINEPTGITISYKSEKGDIMQNNEIFKKQIDEKLKEVEQIFASFGIKDKAVVAESLQEIDNFLVDLLQRESQELQELQSELNATDSLQTEPKTEELAETTPPDEQAVEKIEPAVVEESAETMAQAEAIIQAVEKNEPAVVEAQAEEKIDEQAKEGQIETIVVTPTTEQTAELVDENTGASAVEESKPVVVEAQAEESATETMAQAKAITQAVEENEPTVVEAQAETPAVTLVETIIVEPAPQMEPAQTETIIVEPTPQIPVQTVQTPAPIDEETDV